MSGMQATCALSAAAIQDFARDGFLIARGVLPAVALDPVRRALAAEIAARADELAASGHLTELHPEAGFERRVGLLAAQCPDILTGFDLPDIAQRVVWDLLHHPAMLDAVEALIGPAISINPIQHLRAKPPLAATPEHARGFYAVPWHQDAAVTVEAADASEILTAWTPLVAVDPAMGCVEVMAGAHRLGCLRHLAGAYGTEIDPSVLPALPITPCVMQPGDVLFMHRGCPHRSGDNRTERCRWSLDLRYHRTGDDSGRPWQPKSIARTATASVVDEGLASWNARWDACRATPGGARIYHRIAR
jgi:hypothetical protein